MKALKARNEYLLTLEATNASVFKYYIHDLPDIIDVSINWWQELSAQRFVGFGSLKPGSIVSLVNLILLQLVSVL